MKPGGSEALKHVHAKLRCKGMVAIHLEVDRTNNRALSTYAKLGYATRDKYTIMSLQLE